MLELFNILFEKWIIHKDTCVHSQILYLYINI